MPPSNEANSPDRRGHADDRRRRFRDRRAYSKRWAPSGTFGRIIRFATGPWSSANGLSWFRLIVILIVVQWSILEFYMIPSASMEPTFQGDQRFFHGDRVAVNKLVFGPRLPFVQTRIVQWGEPKRWDVVVFDTVAPGTEEDVHIKRVVALPGERVELRAEGLFINGELTEPPEDLRDVLDYRHGPIDADHVVRDLILGFAQRGEIPLKLARRDDKRIPALRKELKALQPKLRGIKLETLSGKERLDLVREFSRDSVGSVRDWWSDLVGPWGRPRYGIVHRDEYTLVPEGHYYCLGDNGAESYDSRFHGFIPHENLVGRAFAIAYPPQRISDLTGFSKSTPGRLALIAIPLAILLWELVPGFLWFSWRVRGPIESLGLIRRDHVLVDRITLGPRIPFTTKRLIWRRNPAPGEIICYSLSARGATDLYFGELTEISEGKFRVRGPESAEEPWLELSRDAVIGIARAVWWPTSRINRIRVTQTEGT